MSGTPLEIIGIAIAVRDAIDGDTSGCDRWFDNLTNELGGEVTADIRALAAWVLKTARVDPQAGRTPHVVGLLGWRQDARFVVTDNNLQTGIVTLRLVDRNTGALSPYPQVASVDMVVWEPGP